MGCTTVGSLSSSEIKLITAPDVVDVSATPVLLPGFDLNNAANDDEALNIGFEDDGGAVRLRAAAGAAARMSGSARA